MCHPDVLVLPLWRHTWTPWPWSVTSTSCGLKTSPKRTNGVSVYTKPESNITLGGTSKHSQQPCMLTRCGTRMTEAANSKWPIYHYCLKGESISEIDIKLITNRLNISGEQHCKDWLRTNQRKIIIPLFVVHSFFFSVSILDTHPTNPILNQANHLTIRYLTHYVESIEWHKHHLLPTQCDVRTNHTCEWSNEVNISIVHLSINEGNTVDIISKYTISTNVHHVAQDMVFSSSISPLSRFCDCLQSKINISTRPVIMILYKWPIH